MRVLRRVLGGLAAAVLAACAPVPPAPQEALNEAAPAPMACPGGLPEGTRCLQGTDSAGAHYVVAMPSHWSGHLVLHAHGGPHLGPPRLQRSIEDLKRWSVMVKAGHAWAGSTYRQGGVAVVSAAEDTERLRRIFVRHVAVPVRTLLHGQSWGASVAARAAELFTPSAQGRRPYDGVLLTSGVLGGGTRSYDFRLDLRVLYQHLCRNHPLPEEPDYPLWMGLPAGATLTPAQLRARVDACLGLNLPPAHRSAVQQRRVHTLVAVLRVPESSLVGHMNRATFDFQDIALHRAGGGSPFGNIGAMYRGSDDDAALNAAVARYAADPAAVARFGADADPTGRIPVPVLTVHGIHDAVAFVELESTFRETMKGAGTAGHLVQTFTEDAEHSYLTDPAYPTLVNALLAWVETGKMPTPAGIAQACPALEARFGPGCRFVPGYQPAPLSSRVTPRQRP
ncbi:MAG: hypothetical protein HY855_17465 [Burkholderiales bacterium]|nr:hypothetical protein [Burkholderiales bacterium]